MERPAEGTPVAGEVISHTFLGPVTRLKVIGPDGDLISDVSTARAGTLPVGMKVVAHVPAGDTRVLSLDAPEEEPASEAPAPAGP